MAAGYVYILVNAYYPGLVKIGSTTGSPDERARELSKATGVPTPFAVVHAVRVGDCERAEKESHRCLYQFRENSRREFFRVQPKEAIRVVDEVAEKYPPELQSNSATNYSLESNGPTRTIRSQLPVLLIVGGVVLLFASWGLIVEAVQYARQPEQVQKGFPQQPQVEREAERAAVEDRETIEQDHRTIFAYMKKRHPVIDNMRDVRWFDPVDATTVGNKQEEGKLYWLQGTIRRVKVGDPKWRFETVPLDFYFLVKEGDVLGSERADSDYGGLKRFKLLD